MKALEDRLAKMETTLRVRNELTTDTTEQDRNIIPPPVQSESQPPTSHVPRESPGSHAPATSTSRLPPSVLALEARLRATSFFDRLQDRVKSCMSGGPVLLHDTDKWLLRNTISETFNEFPIFHAPWLLDQLEQDLPTKNSNPTWWCCVCAIVALAIPVKALNRDFRKVAAFARAIFRTAYSDLPLMVSQGHDLQAVQAVLAMAMFSRLLGDIKTASILSSTAARMLQAYCLPGMDPDPPLSQADIEKQLRACFWAAYILDADISLHNGLSPSFSQPDIDMELPSPQYLEPGELSQAGLPVHHGTVFRLRAELSTIQSRIRRDLYSANAMNIPSNELVATLLRLTTAVEGWKSRVPPEILLDSSSDDVSLDGAVLHLHFAYYNCISMTYWAVRRHGIWKLRFDENAVGCQDEISGGKVRAAARATLQLIERIRAPQFTTLW